MTPEERAKKIRNEWSEKCEDSFGGTNPFSPQGLKFLDEIIVTEIRAAVEEERRYWQQFMIRSFAVKEYPENPGYIDAENPPDGGPYRC